MGDEPRPNSTRNELLIGVACILLAFVLVLGLLAAGFYVNRNTPRPGYGPNAYLGRPPGARLDVDIYGDPRYGGTIPEHVTVAQFQRKVNYPVPRVPVLGPPRRVDYWPTMPYLARLVWLRPAGEVWLLLEAIRDHEDLERMRAAMKPLQAANGSWRITALSILGSPCSYYTGGLMGDMPNAMVIAPDRKVLLTFESKTLSPGKAKVWLASYLRTISPKKRGASRQGRRAGALSR